MHTAILSLFLFNQIATNKLNNSSPPPCPSHECSTNLDKSIHLIKKLFCFIELYKIEEMC